MASGWLLLKHVLPLPSTRAFLVTVAPLGRRVTWGTQALKAGM